MVTHIRIRNPIGRKMLTVSRIYDDDYGCEEREPNAPKMAIVYLKEENGGNRTI